MHLTTSYIEDFMRARTYYDISAAKTKRINQPQPNLLKELLSMSHSPENVSPDEEKQVRSNRKMLVLAVVGIIAVGLVISQPWWYPKTENAEGLAPDFSLVDIDGNDFTLSSHLGKVVVLNFMATWCGECRSEIPELESVWALYNKTIVIASINIDPFETEEQIRTFRDSYQNATWTWIRDTANVAEAYGVIWIPEAVIVDKNGVIAFTHTGSVHSPTLISEIEQLVG